MSKPTEEYEWAEDPNAEVDEPDTERAEGWQFQDVPPAEQKNWLQRMVGRWFSYFEDWTDGHDHLDDGSIGSASLINLFDEVDVGDEGDFSLGQDSVGTHLIEYLATGQAIFSASVHRARDWLESDSLRPEDDQERRITVEHESGDPTELDIRGVLYVSDEIRGDSESTTDPAIYFRDSDGSDSAVLDAFAARVLDLIDCRGVSTPEGNPGFQIVDTDQAPDYLEARNIFNAKARVEPGGFESNTLGVVDTQKLADGEYFIELEDPAEETSDLEVLISVESDSPVQWAYEPVDSTSDGTYDVGVYLWDQNQDPVDKNFTAYIKSKDH